ncbi:MAG TPA: DUF2442 domain-containing protein [Phycisphaerae bacterium]|nr:DUF2442 domain-containing protein [Phycisphaerae bacterium]
MPSLRNGKRTSKSPSVSVENITRWGIWLFVMGREYFLDYDQFPWFRDARVKEIQNVRLVRKSYLRWPQLDVDLELESLSNPGNYPLIYK